MYILAFLIKAYIAVILFRYVMTRQELYFNALGKMLATLTEPIFDRGLKLTKKKYDQMVPVFIAVLGVLYGLFIWVFTGTALPTAVLYAFNDVLQFLMLFYVVAIIAGSLVNRPGMSHYTVYFYRLATPVVQLARAFVKMPGNAVIIPAIALVVIVFAVLDFVLLGAANVLSGGGFAAALTAKLVMVNLLQGILGLLDIVILLIIVRALMSWVSPDPRNPIVQFISAMTDPIMVPFSRVIPPLGMVDISPIVLIFLLYFIKNLLIRIIGMGM